MGWSVSNQECVWGTLMMLVTCSVEHGKMPRNLPMAKGPLADLHHQMTEGLRRLTAEEYQMSEQSVGVLPFGTEVDDIDPNKNEIDEEKPYQIAPLPFTNETPATDNLAKVMKRWFHGILSKLDWIGMDHY